MRKVTPVVIPQENVNDQSVRLLAWLVANGQKVDKGQAIAQVEGSKATFEVYAPAAGVIEYGYAEATEVDVGAVLCTLRGEEQPEGAGVPSPDPATQTTGHAATPAPQAPAEASAALPEGNGTAAGARLSDAARQLLQQRGLAPETFAGRGLVRARDVLEYLGERPPETARSAAPPAGAGQTGPAAAAPPAGVPFRTEPLSRAKQTEIRHLHSAHQNTLPSCVTVAVPTRGLRAAAEQHLGGGNATAILLFETARLLRRYPLFNAFYAGGAANVYEEVNVGFAVDAGHGLKVPVIRTADKKALPEIAGEMQELLVQYLNGSLPPSALAGGTFTVTDLSGEGAFEFLPMLNQAQSAILGVGEEFFPPGVKEGVFNLILAFDHQLAEGRQAARFLNELRTRLQGYEAALRTDGPRPKEEPCCGECLRPLHELQASSAYLVPTVGAGRSQGLICTMCLLGWS
jgi:pyruvate/2-oxoglutarate dehydrogenase complex dihydrolipoamide acyltransferase (E2) component